MGASQRYSLQNKIEFIAIQWSSSFGSVVSFHSNKNKLEVFVSGSSEVSTRNSSKNNFDPLTPGTDDITCQWEGGGEGGFRSQ